MISKRGKKSCLKRKQSPKTEYTLINHARAAEFQYRLFREPEARQNSNAETGMQVRTKQKTRPLRTNRTRRSRRYYLGQIARHRTHMQIGETRAKYQTEEEEEEEKRANGK